MPKATRLNHLPGQPGNLRTATREAMATLWTIEGHKGLFWYVQGCKAGHLPNADEVVAETGSSFAIFKRDETVEYLVCQALGVAVP